MIYVDRDLSMRLVEWLTVLAPLLGSERAHVCTHALATTSIGSPLHLIKTSFQKLQAFFVSGLGLELRLQSVGRFLFVLFLQAAEVENSESSGSGGRESRRFIS